ncbi:PAAR domain-containing protein [Budvicia aquatica]|uniref:PAAR domain-containing protein n=1 Tax=Budvicia aquatica TaxID=82979 RepID=UPI0020872F65|nr:PAAR domain-containing protein [Budvicia aquatica]GKX52744.1 hypothetical protein SOASR029_30530 [Budvicia aquatica]
MRMMVQGKKIIVKGDTSTTGGTVLTGSADSSNDGKEIALVGDKVLCAACKATGVIAEGSAVMKIKGIPVALEGHIVTCACPPGSHRLIAKG